jgi:glycine cleavage system aminomethyltransferase T
MTVWVAVAQVTGFRESERAYSSCCRGRRTRGMARVGEKRKREELEVFDLNGVGRFGRGDGRATEARTSGVDMLCSAAVCPTTGQPIGQAVIKAVCDEQTAEVVFRAS